MHENYNYYYVAVNHGKPGLNVLFVVYIYIIYINYIYIYIFIYTFIQR